VILGPAARRLEQHVSRSKTAAKFPDARDPYASEHFQRRAFVALSNNAEGSTSNTFASFSIIETRVLYLPSSMALMYVLSTPASSASFC
jgi:hypothetical protein